ncbi:hypothetical protein [Pedobacter sp. JY14-1]|uniref:hypothetical protein n=1 Tax=Pedobacter sp. JY14-1 TaxID=3034151 RepID=UPI0023E31658|nr:hypothetical protein [Pedobacter sp. JY14-1]
MNNIKKTGLGLLVAALAFGFSAFTNKRTTSTYRFYKKNLAAYPNASDYRGYVYYSGDYCESGGSLCSALWSIDDSVNLLEGTPLPSLSTFQDGVATGHAEF